MILAAATYKNGELETIPAGSLVAYNGNGYVVRATGTLLVEEAAPLQLPPALIQQDEALAVIRQIDAGELTVTADTTDADRGGGYLSGVVRFTTSNDWMIAAFFDSNDFDYIERMYAPDGRVVDFDDMTARTGADPLAWYSGEMAMPELAAYRPTDEAIAKRWLGR